LAANTAAAPETKRVYLPVPAVGEVFRNPGYGQALRLLATEGPHDFYEGEIAPAILTTSKETRRHLETATPSPLGPHSAAELHKNIEAMKLAYADLQPYVADPSFFNSLVTALLDKKYAAERAKLIDPKKANCL